MLRVARHDINRFAPMRAVSRLRLRISEGDRRETKSYRLEPKTFSQTDRVDCRARVAWACCNEARARTVCESKPYHRRPRGRRLLSESVCGQYLAAPGGMGLNHGTVDRCRL